MITFAEAEQLANGLNMSLSLTYQYILRNDEGSIVCSSNHLIDIINYLRSL